MKLGDTIQLTDEQRNALRPYEDSLRNAQVAFQNASKWIQAAEIELFKCVDELLPETVGFHKTLSHITGVVTIQMKQDQSSLDLMEILRDVNKKYSDLT